MVARQAATRLAIGSDVRSGEAGTWLLGEAVATVVTDAVAVAMARWS